VKNVSSVSENKLKERKKRQRGHVFFHVLLQAKNKSEYWYKEKAVLQVSKEEFNGSFLRPIYFSFFFHYQLFFSSIKTRENVRRTREKKYLPNRLDRAAL
jgi:hypothetical protein